jgi:4-hydroxy-tetrahydrodipicolinate synthase
LLDYRRCAALSPGDLMFEGTMTALVTPFRDGRVDERALEALIESQIAGGIDGLVPCGTTGEATTLSSAEHAEVVRITVRVAKKRVPVIAGAGSNSTAHAIELGRAAREAGADGVLSVTPYYNKPSQEGCFRHYEAIARASELPVVLYNVPGRTNVDLQVDTLVRLAALPKIVAIKEATGSVARSLAIRARLGDRFAILSGEDAINYPLYAVGAKGCISVLGNVAPALVAEVWDAHRAGDAARALAAHTRSLPLTDALFCDTNPIPVKAALALLGRIGPELRLPLYPLAADATERLRPLLAAVGIS